MTIETAANICATHPQILWAKRTAIFRNLRALVIGLAFLGGTSIILTSAVERHVVAFRGTCGFPANRWTGCCIRRFLLLLMALT